MLKLPACPKCNEGPLAFRHLIPKIDEPRMVQVYVTECETCRKISMFIRVQDGLQEW